MGFPSPSQAPFSPSPAQLLPDGWVSRSSILRTIHFWGISAQSFLQLCRNVWGIIRIRPGGYKPPNTFRMCHLYSKHLAPTTGQSILWPEDNPGKHTDPHFAKEGTETLQEWAVWSHTCTNGWHVTGTWTFWPKSFSSFLFSQCFYTFSASNRHLWRSRDTSGTFISFEQSLQITQKFLSSWSRIQTLCLQCQNNVTRSKTFEFSSEAKGKRLPHVFITKKNSVSKTPAFWRYYEHTQDWVATFFLTTKVWVCQRASSIHGRSTGWSEGISRAESSGHQGLLVKR